VTSSKNSKSTTVRDSPEEYLEYNLAHSSKHIARDRSVSDKQRLKSYRSEAFSGSSERGKDSESNDCRKIFFKKRTKCSYSESSETQQDSMPHQFSRKPQGQVATSNTKQIQRKKMPDESFSTSMFAESIYDTANATSNCLSPASSTTTCYCNTDSDAEQSKMIHLKKDRQVGILTKNAHRLFCFFYCHMRAMGVTFFSVRTTWYYNIVFFIPLFYLFFYLWFRCWAVARLWMSQSFSALPFREFFRAPIS